MTKEERIFNAGWKLAADWANRDDLLADIDSPRYRKDRAEALAFEHATAKEKPTLGAVNAMLQDPFFSFYPVQEFLVEQKLRTNQELCISIKSYHGVSFDRMTRRDVVWLYGLLRDAFKLHMNPDLQLYQHPKLVQKPRPWYNRWLFTD